MECVRSLASSQHGILETFEQFREDVSSSEQAAFALALVAVQPVEESDELLAPLYDECTHLARRLK